MLTLIGESALSSFRLKKLVSDLQNIIPQIITIETKTIYFVSLEQALNTQELVTLQRVLHNTELIELANNHIHSLSENNSSNTNLENNILQFLTIPRLGTISPWSSKATDILQHCGLQKINRIEMGIVYELIASENILPISAERLHQIEMLLHDPMTQKITQSIGDAQALFFHYEPKPFQTINIQKNGRDALMQANKNLGLALTNDEIDYLYESFRELQRNPTDVELMMFAQANSEHSRHKIFNANWIINEDSKPLTLFQMIQFTHEKNPASTILAYKDNAAILTGSDGKRFFADAKTNAYHYVDEPIHMVIKVETHNHPTAIAPFPGAATGAGGEIRDEGATGLGAKPKAGMTGYSVSNLKIPDFIQPWEHDYGKPAHFASALQIMLTAPIGAAAFNNEFGRPNLCGYFRTYEQAVKYNQHSHQAHQSNHAKIIIRGYHKPIMIAGGYGNIRPEHIAKKSLPVRTQIVILGGPAMLIGLGGSAASSKAAGTNQTELDFASVQRANPEMQRRAQEVINSCCALGADNPILSIHDVGAGGLANAIPELLHADNRGGRIELRTIPNDEPGMTPLEIWCNEAQERYVLAIKESALAKFCKIAERERCLYGIVGEIIADEELIVGDGYFDNYPVDLPLSLLFGNTPKMLKNVTSHIHSNPDFIIKDIDLSEAAQRVLNLPVVSNKSFLITIGDRSVGGLTARDQMVGPWQVPVADCAVTNTSFINYSGEAMAVGERAPLALIHPAASAKMAVAEAITNIACTTIGEISKIKISANWMAACGFPGEEAALFDAVQAVAMKLCPELGLSIPVGKDSLSMEANWSEHHSEKVGKAEKTEQVDKTVVAPLSLVVTAFAPVTDVRHTITPQLKLDHGDTDLIFIDLAKGHQRMAGSALAEVYNQIGNTCPDVDDPEAIKAFFAAIQTLIKDNLLLAYHDRSDGGLFVTLCEMAFAGHVGIAILLNDLGDDPIKILFNEELGAVIQVRHCDTDNVLSCLREYGLSHHSFVIGTLNDTDKIEFFHHKQTVLSDTRINLMQQWSQTSYHMQKLRDNPICAEQEFAVISQANDPGLTARLTFEPVEDIAAPYIQKNVQPAIAILREQGVNGHIEMAAAFQHAGFDCQDVHMSDIISGRVTLDKFIGLVACGGFSYGDVLGAGRGWANTILHNARASEQFSNFFLDTGTFALGVCNGCQMLSHLTELIPGTSHWPRFQRNASEQFEARLSRVQIVASPSILFTDMVGSYLPIVVSHGEGRAEWAAEKDFLLAKQQQLISLQYVDNFNAITENYPANPNGSPEGITALTSLDGRFNIIMPHPERVFRTVQFSWHPKEWGENSPWMRMFRNVRVWVG